MPSNPIKACPFCAETSACNHLEILHYGPKDDSTKQQHPLLFVHGGWHNAECWRDYFLPYFSSIGYDCYAISLRGHGKSPGADKINSHSVTDYCKDICSVSSQLDSTPIIVAHSFGGFISSHYVLHHKPSALILLAPVPPTTGMWTVSWKIFLKHPLKVLLTLLTANCKIVMNTSKIAKEFLFSPTLPTFKVNYFFSKLGSESYRAFLDSLFNLPKKPTIDFPVLILGAENDQLIDKKNNLSTAEFLSGEFIEINGIAHNMMNDESWLKTAKVIKEFVQRLPLQNSNKAS